MLLFSFFPVRSVKIIFIPLFKKASSLILFISIFGLNLMDEKISLEGKNVICVPVSFDLPTFLSGALASPLINSIKYF